MGGGPTALALAKCLSKSRTEAWKKDFNCLDIGGLTCGARYNCTVPSTTQNATNTSSAPTVNYCDTSAAPTNGASGDCTASLAAGASCQPTCNAGYVVSGKTTCDSSATLKAASCKQATCVNGQITGTTCICNKGYTGGGRWKSGSEYPSCVEKTCDASAPPENGTVGDCTATLKPGARCQPMCNTGFRISGKSKCSADGVLSAAMCVEIAPCKFAGVSHGKKGDCGDSIALGASCQPVCDKYYESSGATTCSQDGVIKQTKCTHIACDASTPVPNGMLGNCSSTLRAGRSCQSTCNHGYFSSGPTLCSEDGTLKPSTCSIPCQSIDIAFIAEIASCKGSRSAHEVASCEAGPTAKIAKMCKSCLSVPGNTLVDCASKADVFSGYDRFFKCPTQSTACRTDPACNQQLFQKPANRSKLVGKAGRIAMDRLANLETCVSMPACLRKQCSLCPKRIASNPTEDACSCWSFCDKSQCTASLASAEQNITSRVCRKFVPNTVSTQISLAQDISSITLGSLQRAQFEQRFQLDVAKALGGIKENRIFINSIKSGSVIVEFSVAPDATGQPIAASTITQAFSKAGIQVAGTTTTKAIAASTVMPPATALVPPNFDSLLRKSSGSCKAFSYGAGCVCAEYVCLQH